MTTSPWVKQMLGGGAIHAGLACPIAVCVMTLWVGGRWIRETMGHRIDTPIR